MPFMHNRINGIFIWSYQKKVVYLHPQFHAGDVCTSSAWVADIIKAFISACFGVMKSCKISPYPKQEGSKRPLGYVYPATEHPLLDCSVWWHFISAWALCAYSYREGSCRNLITKNKQR